MFLLSVCCCLLTVVPTETQEGKKAGPYTFLIATGPERGSEHCYVCEVGEKPAVYVFARSLDENLGKFMAKVDKLVPKYSEKGLKSWVTFVGGEQSKMEPRIVSWTKKHGLKHIPTGLFEKQEGPPGYQLDQKVKYALFIIHQGKVVKMELIREDSFPLSQAENWFQLITEKCK